MAGLYFNVDSGKLEASTKIGEGKNVKDNTNSPPREIDPGQGGAQSNNIQISEVISVIMRRCKLFENTIEIAAQNKLKINRAFVEDLKGGKGTKFIDVAGPTATVVLSLACGITVAVGIATFGVASFAGSAVAGATLVVKSVDKQFKQAEAKVVEKVVEEATEKANVSSYLNCIVKEVAKELSRIFEYQLFQLKNDKQVEILAQCAVDLMLNLKKNDTFDRNTLLKKVLRDGKIKEKKLLTRNEDKWSAPDVFRKPGLRRMIVETDRAECIYQVKPNGARDAKTYGYRGQFVEMKQYVGEKEEATTEGVAELADGEIPNFEGLCKGCSEFYSSGKYFVESDIDGEYTKQCQEAMIYRPLHVLVQCPKVLHSFIDNLQENPSFADFLKRMIGFHDDDMLRPVYRQHVPGKVLDCFQASKADFTGTDFSHSDFTNSSLEECDFTKCVMLFAKLTGSKMRSGSKFVDTLISHSNLVEVEADRCEWTKTSLLYSRVDDAHLGDVEPSIGGNCFDGTNIDDAITGKKRELNWYESLQGGKSKDEIDNKDPITDVPEYIVPIMESSGQTPDNSITVSEKGGCFSIPVASAFLLFPPQAVEEQVTLTCSRVRYIECEEKPKDGDIFVTRILKVEPEGVTFKKPVTVLLSHSAYEDQVFLDFYELVVESLSPTGWQELKTERISSLEDVPNEILTPEVLDDYLPFAKATIQETCTLVATTRISYDQILIPTNRSYTFSKQYGENAELNITFPAGVTEEMLKFKSSVSGQTTPFLKAVDVELTYSHSDVANIKEEFLPIGKTEFTTEYGLLLHSHKEAESKVNESNVAYIERLRRNQLKVSFSVEHFSDYQPAMKIRSESFVPPSNERNINSKGRYGAIVLAMHKINSIQNTLHAVLAPKEMLRTVKDNWNVVDGIRKFEEPVKSGEPIFLCVPLSDSDDNDHLLLKNYTLWFDPDPVIESELHNNTKNSTDLRGRNMHFLKDRMCNNGKNHSQILEQDCRAIAPILNRNQSEALIVQASTEHRELTLDSESPQRHNVLSCQGGILNNNIQVSKVISAMITRCELFEKRIKTAAQKKLEVYRASVEHPEGGKVTKFYTDVAGPTATIVFSLACGITVATGLATFGAASFCAAVVAGATLAVKIVGKRSERSHAKVVENAVVEVEETNMSSYLNCVITDVAKELSRIFEDQLYQLKHSYVGILAECAVDLMLNLKEGDSFDRNTLLKKVLRDGKIKEKKLLTRNEDKWSAPDVFRKPGLRRTIVETGRAKCIYQVKQGDVCDTKTYGYRGQFLEMQEYHGQRKQGPTEEVPVGVVKFFVESDIDSEYTQEREESMIYRPLHLLVQRPEVLDDFIGNLQENPSLALADFLKRMFGFHDSVMLRPVYRQHVPGKVPDLQKLDLTGSDFSYSNFTNSSLEKCNFTKCVMLFANLARAKMSGSKFVATLISHSNLEKVEADDSIWANTSVLYSNMDGMNLHNSHFKGGICWEGTNIEKANFGDVGKTDSNGINHLMEIPIQTPHSHRSVSLV